MTTIIPFNKPTKGESESSAKQTASEKGPDIEVLLVTLGRILLETKEFRDEHRSGWISMIRISRLSEKYWKHLARISMTKADLDMQARVYFERNSQIDADGVRVSWKKEFTSPSGPHLFIRFEKLYPDGTRA
jgi:hypothetical protein